MEKKISEGLVFKNLQAAVDALLDNVTSSLDTILENAIAAADIRKGDCEISQSNQHNAGPPLSPQNLSSSREI